MARGVLLPVVRAWLVCQLLAAFGAPLVVWVSSQHLQVTECQCPHGPGTTCPMHETPKGRNGCAFRSASRDGASALLSVFGAIGLAPSVPIAYLTGISFPLDAHVSVALDRRFDPDPPPPRASRSHLL